MAESNKRSGGRSGGSAKGRSSSSSSRSRSSASSSGRSRSSSSRSSSSRSTASRSGSSRSSSSGSTAQKRRAAARKGGQARARQQKAEKAGRSAAAPLSGKSAAEVREAITRGVIRPLNLVMLTRDRIEEVFDDAVSRGRMTADDAQQLVQGLVQRGRKQTNDVLRDLEQLLGRGRDEIGSRGAGARKAAEGAATRARVAADPVLAQADRARRVAGVGPSFPVTGYDDLTAAQVQSRLAGLSPAELRKVRDYERRNANRKSVLDSIQQKLET